MTNSVSSTRYNVAAFFSGVGGIELGFEKTNKFRVVYANEIDKNARITYKLNFPDVFLDPRSKTRRNKGGKVRCYCGRIPVSSI